MSLQKPLEGLLRPPLEWYTASTAAMSGLFCLLEPRLFWPDDLLTYPLSFFIIGG